VKKKVCLGLDGALTATRHQDTSTRLTWLRIIFSFFLVKNFECKIFEEVSDRRFKLKLANVTLTCPKDQKKKG